MCNETPFIVEKISPRVGLGLGFAMNMLLNDEYLLLALEQEIQPTGCGSQILH